jgi:hypothetical protein
MYDLLLFLHILAAAGLFAAMATYSAVAFGASVDSRSLSIANVSWNASAGAILILGILLVVIDDDEAGLPHYGIFDGWILLAIVLWLAAGGIGEAAQRGLDGRGDGSVVMDSRQRLMHWLRVATVIALLVVMIWKPGA